jgi:hypothetical protein
MTRVSEPTWCAPGDLTVEHQAHLTGPAEIEVLPDHLLEEDASRHRLIEHLGERKLGLQDGERIAIAGGAITRRKRMRQAAQPLAQQSIDPVRRKPIAQLLHQLGVGARFYAVVERLEFNCALGQLALEVFVAVDAEFGVVGEEYTLRYIRSIASSSSTTWSRSTSATDRATLIPDSGRPRVLRPTELRALIFRASSLQARSESTYHWRLRSTRRLPHTPRRSEALASLVFLQGT